MILTETRRIVAVCILMATLLPGCPGPGPGSSQGPVVRELHTGRLASVAKGIYHPATWDTWAYTENSTITFADGTQIVGLLGAKQWIIGGQVTVVETVDEYGWRDLTLKSVGKHP